MIEIDLGVVMTVYVFVVILRAAIGTIEFRNAGGVIRGAKDLDMGEELYILGYFALSIAFLFFAIVPLAILKAVSYIKGRSDED